MALALPVLLAVVALACSKEQNAPAQTTKRLSVDIVRQFKITRDSVKYAISYKPLFVRGNANKNGQALRISFDTLGSKANLDFKQADRVSIMGKVVEDQVMDYQNPPPPPPKVGP
jgi:hypothetical protein